MEDLKTMQNNSMVSQKIMVPIENLFKESFEIYKNSFWSFIKLAFIGSIGFIVVIPFGIAWAVAMLFSGFWFSFPFFLVFFVVLLAVILVCFWIQVSLLFLIKNRAKKPTLKDSLREGWNHLLPLIWIYFLTGLVSFLGFLLLIIPGIIFTTWFLFSRYVFVVEGKRGTQALVASRNLVKGHWWPVFFRLLLIGLLPLVISWIPFAGGIINLFFTMPFSLIYFYLIYENLKAIKS